MSLLADIHDDAAGAVKAAVEAAYEAGRADGRREALSELQTHMTSFFGGDSAPAKASLAVTPEPADKAEGRVAEGRAAPGSVKPIVERMLTDAENGLTPLEIAERAGFKYNSVRGTLWALGKEGFAESRAGRWYAVGKNEEGSPAEANEPALID